MYPLDWDQASIELEDVAFTRPISTPFGIYERYVKSDKRCKEMHVSAYFLTERGVVVLASKGRSVGVPMHMVVRLVAVMDAVMAQMQVLAGELREVAASLEPGALPPFPPLQLGPTGMVTVVQPDAEPDEPVPAIAAQPTIAPMAASSAEVGNMARDLSAEGGMSDEERRSLAAAVERTQKQARSRWGAKK